MVDQDQIIDATMARSIQTDAARIHAMLAWVVSRDNSHYPGKFVARLRTKAPTPYVLLANTLGELHAQLPPGTRWSKRRSYDPPEVLEVWFVLTG